MTSKERLLAAMRLEEPDRVPVAPFITSGWLGHATPAMAERLVRETDILLSPGIAWDAGLFLGAEALNAYEGWTEGNRYIRTIRTPKGLLRSVYTITEKTGYTTEFFFKGPEDVEKFLSVPYEPIPIDPSEYHHMEAKYGDEMLILGGMLDALYLPGFWFSPEDFNVTCLENFDLIKLLLDTVQPRLLDAVRTCKEEGIIYFRQVGAEVASQTLMDPSWFAKLVAPYDTELNAEMRKDGGIAYMHCHGKVNQILEQMADTGPTALDPLEGPPHGDVDLADAKRRIGDRVCLVGNLDDMEFIAAKSRQEIWDASIACIEAAGPSGYILGGTTAGIYTPELAEGYLVMAEAARSLA